MTTIITQEHQGPTLDASVQNDGEPLTAHSPNRRNILLGGTTFATAAALSVVAPVTVA